MKCPRCQCPDLDPRRPCAVCGFAYQAGVPGGETVVIDGPAFAGESMQEGEPIGNYEIIRELGRGGMGVVYLVRHAISGEPYALKLVRPELSQFEDIRRRFISEIITSQKLHHQNIVRVFQPETDADLLFFTMEHVQGKNLREMLDERKDRVPPFTVPEACAVLHAVLDALDHAHTRTPPVVHRDLKPENIIIAGGFPDIAVKVVDFGLATVLSSSRLTRTDAVMGTAYYMAPEQLQGGRATDAADLYAAGVLLYEMLTGKIPSARAKLPGEMFREVPQVLDSLLDRALQEVPLNRPQSAAAMRHTLAALREQGDAGPLPGGAAPVRIAKDPKREAPPATTGGVQEIDWPDGGFMAPAQASRQFHAGSGGGASGHKGEFASILKNLSWAIIPLAIFIVIAMGLFALAQDVVHDVLIWLNSLR